VARLAAFWRNLRHRDRVERDLDDEVREIFALLVDEKIRAGLGPADARRAATLELGRVETVKDSVRDVRAGAFADTLALDVRYAVRLLQRDPVFALTAALSLAIGIGATTAVFTAANGLLFRTAPGVADPDRVVDVTRTNGQFGVNLISGPNYQDIRARTTTLEGVYAYRPSLVPVNVEGAGATGGGEPAFGNVVSTNYFTVLGVRAAIGRVFEARENDQLGADPIVVLSHQFWTRRFNADPAIVGQTVRLNTYPYSVIGVAREGFLGTTVIAPDLWVPSGARPFTDGGVNVRFAAAALVGGRLKPNVSRAQAAAEIDAIGRALEQEYPDENRGYGLSVSASSPIPAGLRLVAAGFLALLLAIVSLVLVIACANVAGVLLARGTIRRREIAVRLAMGVGRWRLVRQLLTETLLLFVLGGAAGLLLAREMLWLLLRALPSFAVPVNLSLPLDVRVVAFTTGVSLVAAVLSGLAPALHASKVDVVSALKQDVQGPSDRLRLRSAFVVAQVAFSILLVVIAGLLVRALDRTSSVDQGFDPHGVEVTSLDLTTGGYTSVTGSLFAGELVERAYAAGSAECDVGVRTCDGCGRDGDVREHSGRDAGRIALLFCRREHRRARLLFDDAHTAGGGAGFYCRRSRPRRAGRDCQRERRAPVLAGHAQRRSARADARLVRRRGDDPSAVGPEAARGKV
jgi:predicted permease